MAQSPDSVAQSAAAYREGRNAGLAIGALSIAALAYIQLLSLEKSLLAIALAWLVLSRAGAPATRRLAGWALAIAIVHVPLWLAGIYSMLAHHDELAKLLQMASQFLLHHG